MGLKRILKATRNELLWDRELLDHPIRSSSSYSLSKSACDLIIIVTRSIINQRNYLCFIQMNATHWQMQTTSNSHFVWIFIAFRQFLISSKTKSRMFHSTVKKHIIDESMLHLDGNPFKVRFFSTLPDVTSGWIAFKLLFYFRW